MSGGLDSPLISLATLPDLVNFPHWVRIFWSIASLFSNAQPPGFVLEVWVLKGEMRWPTPPTSAVASPSALHFCAAAFVRDGESALASGLLMLLVSSPGVIIPCSFIMLMHVLMSAPCGDTLHGNCGVSYMTSVHLFNLVFALYSLHSPNLSCYLLCTPMSSLSPHSPLSLSSDSHDSSTDLQNPLPATNSNAQYSIPPLLDGVQPHNPASPSDPARATFASILKLGLGSHGSSKLSISEPEPSIQHEISKSPGGRFNREILEPDPAARFFGFFSAV